ncbi:ABC transporter permease [Enterococcus sp. BWR-S5]|uniref:ABC transporter permease n=1 Tax=Enterococcus sp. BWR-S5 TaxID=2787714 RepID=UPI0019219C2C|nr:ABC transporter permease [Enterococcus sp. BWR-S5]MBL1227178.1 ABC transporter permease [Enterococcus sp. BWR-S5]
MSVFKTFYYILRENKISVILGFAVSIGISFMYAGNLNSNESSFEATESKIAVFNKDNSPEAAALVDYLKDTMDYVPFKGSQEAIDDALYFEELNYVLEIPKGFGTSLQAGTSDLKLDVQVKAGSFNQVYVDNIINHYLSTYQFYAAAFPNKTAEQINQLTTENVTVTGQVNFDKNFNQLEKNQGTAGVFSVISYGLFMTIFSGISIVNLAFNRDEIRRRNSCSPVSKKSFSRQLMTSSLLFSGVVWAAFIAYTLVYTRIGFNSHTMYFLLNSLVFLAAVIAFSIFITGLIKSSELIGAVNNTFILGSSFIGGVFVPSEILPDVVNKIASFTPTYWFVRNNKLIGGSLKLDSIFLKDFQFNLFVLLIFALIFFLLAMLTKRERGGLKVSLFRKAVS